jgi:hypothetical protein
MSGDESGWTCGKGVAANAVLPDGMADLLTAVGAVLDHHTRSLDPKEPNGQREIAAYRGVVQEHRVVAERLTGLAALMRSHQDLPIAEHDMAILTNAESIEAMAAFVAAEEKLLGLLRHRVAEHSAMLQQMTHA